MRLTARLCLIAALAGGPFAGAAPVPRERMPDKDLAAVKTKLVGPWRGGPCVGELTLRANGTYEWTGIGPGGEQHSGIWWLKGDPASVVCVHSKR